MGIVSVTAVSDIKVLTLIPHWSDNFPFVFCTAFYHATCYIWMVCDKSSLQTGQDPFSCENGP